MTKKVEKFDKIRRLKQKQPLPFEGKRVLDVGAGEAGGTAAASFPGAEIVTLDPFHDADIQVDLESEAFQLIEPEPFDFILMSHVLEHVSIARTHEVLVKMHDLLVPGGQLHVMVPALEWAAALILKEDVPMAAIMHIYGHQADGGQYHKNGFTMMRLRLYVQLAGFIIDRAGVGSYGLTVAGKEYRPTQHYVVGSRPIEEETDDEN